jgi:O-antigen/teichoic acid export membrane protein
MLGKHKYLLYSALLTTAISLLTNVVFTMQYGVTGAAISFSITIMTASLIRIYFVKRHLYVGLKCCHTIIFKTVSSIAVMEFALMHLGGLSGFNKTIVANVVLFILMIVFIAYHQKKIRENLKFIGLIDQIAQK